jgi:hypothetical protein
MARNRRVSFLGIVTFALSLTGLSAFGQAPQTYKARLSIVPVANANARNTIDESATVFATANATATLTGTKLAITGTFEGFKAPASIAQIRSGAAMGVRGPVLFDLTVTKATKGTISGTVDLTPAQIDLLKNNRLYIQSTIRTRPKARYGDGF